MILKWWQWLGLVKEFTTKWIFIYNYFLHETQQKTINLSECLAQTVWLQIIIKPSYKYHKSISKVVCMTYALYSTSSKAIFYVWNIDLKFEPLIEINVSNDRLKWPWKNVNCIVQQRFLFLTVTYHNHMFSMYHPQEFGFFSMRICLLLIQHIEQWTCRLILTGILSHRTSISGILMWLYSI